jgi:hypothetical protein
MEQKLESEYIHTFYADDELFGIRFGRPKDANQLIEVYKNVYGWNYLYPYVYKEKVLREKLSEEDHYWFPVDNVEMEEIVGAGALKKLNNYSVYIARLACKKEYQGKGLAGILGAICMKTLYQMHVFDGVLRLECDVRGKARKSQGFVEKTGSIPYGFIPNFNNYADKRLYKIRDGKPFTRGRIEPVIMYFQPFNDFWDKRLKEIYLYEDNRILRMYELLREINKRKMRKDKVHKKKLPKNPKVSSSYDISKDYYKAIVSISGYLNEAEINSIIEGYSNWNLIEWRIPTTLEGIYSQKLALKKGFIVAGYNIGSNYNHLFEDTVLFNFFPNGLDFKQFNDLNLSDKCKPIVHTVLESIRSKISKD